MFLLKKYWKEFGFVILEILEIFEMKTTKEVPFEIVKWDETKGLQNKTAESSFWAEYLVDFCISENFLDHFQTFPSLLDSH